MTLRCPTCGQGYDDRWRCECGAPLQFDEQPLPAVEQPEDADLDPRDGLWAFSEFLPVGTDPGDRVTLGEGFTPLVDGDARPGGAGSGDADRPTWDAAFKLEYVFPTGSFKDRGATTTLTRAREVGAGTVLEDSSGNAGAAIATYAARAGLPARIYVPDDVAAAKLGAIRRAGAEVVRVAGDREDVTAACVDAVRRGEGWYASHAWNPAFYAGTATMAYEIAHQRDWTAPDAVVMPLGHGTMFLGAARGFAALRAAGWIDRVPRLLGAQAAGYAPIVEAIYGPESAAGTNHVADGIRIRDPVQRDRILEAIAETDGDAIAVSEAAVETELDRLHRAGFYTEPTSAVAPAALREYRGRETLEPDADVVVALSGSGLKG